MTQFTFPKCTDEMARSPEYLNRLIARIKGSYDRMWANNFGAGSVEPASLVDSKSVMHIVLQYDGVVTGTVADKVIDLVNIPEIESPADEGIVLKSIFIVVQDVVGGFDTVDIYRYPAGGGQDLLKSFSFGASREKGSYGPISQCFRKDDLLVLRASVPGAGDELFRPVVVCRFIVPHATS